MRQVWHNASTPVSLDSINLLKTVKLMVTQLRREKSGLDLWDGHQVQGRRDLAP